MKTYILHHNDTDGYGAKYAAWEHFGDEAEYFPVNYGQPVPIQPQSGDRVYILDFSYPLDVIQGFIARGAEVTVIDHHKTAYQALGDQPWFIYDVTKSGCILAWEYFNPNSPMPTILLTIQDWDLWQFKRPDTKELHIVAECNKEDMAWWFNSSYDPSPLYNIGVQLLKYHNNIVDALAKHAWLGTFDGHNVAVANVVYPFISDAGQKIREKFGDQIDMSMTFFVTDKGEHAYSLRSETVDVGEIAKKHGGGGHKNAAGMLLPAHTGPVPL